MSDIGLKLTDNGIELDRNESGSLKRDNGLETAVLVSLFTDARVVESELPPGLTSLRGWWGDEFLPSPGDKIGSKLWTFSRDKVSTETAASIQVRAKQALKWMIEDGVASKVDVVATVENGFIRLDFQIVRPEGKEDKFSVFWDGQSLKR